MPKINAFSRIVGTGQLTGEVVAVNRFIAIVDGLENVRAGSMVVFEDGTNGMVYAVKEGQAQILNLNSENLQLGMFVVVKAPELTIGVSREMPGQVVSALGQSIDSRKILMAEQMQPVFSEPPAFTEREILNDQLETGVTIVDTLFPIVHGQRIAVMGNSKTGKTSFLEQVMINQAKKGRLIVYVLIGKRKIDLELLQDKLRKNKVEDRAIIVMADVFDSLPMSYIAPYSGAAIAEFFWRTVGEDVVIIYDDLTNHAKAYREMSLLLRQNPGREAYPGDMFHTQSMLLERAGKLNTNHKSLTVLPVSVTYNDDITGYLSTNLISITDGQIIFDSDTADQGIRPAVNVGISVSRVGGRGQTDIARKIASQTSKQLASYRSTRETSRFVSEQNDATRIIMQTGERIYEVFKQLPDELFSLAEQQIMLQTVLLSSANDKIDIKTLKKLVKQLQPSAKTDSSIESTANLIMQKLKVGES